MRESILLPLAAGICLTLAAAVPPDLGAQDVEMLGRIHGVRPPPGYYEVLARDPTAYKFQRVWKEVARQVRERRRALAQVGDYATLNAHYVGTRPSRAAAQAAGTALQGTFRIPVLMGYFADSTHTFQPTQAQIDSVLFSTLTAPPYSVTTYYDEVTDGLVTVTGDVIGWFKVDSASTYYEGADNGLDPSTDHTGDFIRELLVQADPTVDFSIYDEDGNGYIDLVAVLHPLAAGECGTTHIWSHRWVLAAWGVSWTGDGKTAWDYMIQPAVGGSNGCNASQTMAIGTFSHELGHGMADLPDLYDTYDNDPDTTNGIGHWGLMGAGNWNVPTSPAHPMAWSKDDVGWLFVDTVTATATIGRHILNPIITSDTALRVNILGTNEYFLLENRHQIGSDAYLHGEGLLIWHIDPDTIAARRNTNAVNAYLPHGVALEQADAQDDLRYRRNRGDAGDPYPGTTPNTAFGPSTAPNSELNDNTSSGVTVDSITVNADQSIAFRVGFSVVDEVITTSVGPGTEVIVDAVREPAPYATIWIYPSMHTIAVDSIQGDTMTRHVFQSWNDAGPRSHTVTVDAMPDTFRANLETQNRVRAVAGPDVGITSSVTLDANGVAWLLPTDTVTLEATASGGAHVLWSGDTATVNNQLRLVMSQPYTVRATRISITSEEVATHLLGAASLLTQDELLFLDLLGNNNGGFDIGDFRAWLQEAGLVADVAPAEFLKAESEKGGKARKEER